jgi:hypothetical protein
MPDATVNIGGDASGAIAAVAAAQAAIDSLTGKTVIVDINVRQHGSSTGGGGLAGAASGLGRVGDAADRAGRAGRGMGDSFDRAGRSALGMGDHVGRSADHAERLRTHMDAVSNIMSGGAPGAVSHASGMRNLAEGAILAGAAVRGIGSDSSRSLGAAETGAIRAGRGMRQLGAGAGSASQFMAGASGAAQQVSRSLVPMAQGADGVYRSVSRMAGAGKDVERFAGSMRTIDAAGRAIDGGGSGGGGGGGLGGLINKLGGIPDVAMPGMRAIRGIGMVAGVSALGMGALAGAVAGVGLAGVAADFAANRQLMKAGGEAVKDFTKQFSAMKAETSAAGMPAMAGVSAAAKGMGHELAQIGAANIAPVLGDVAKLGNQATQAMHKLAPSIGPATQGLTALAGAVLGAFGDSGPAVTSFANTVTQNAAGLQALMSSAISTAGAVGSATVGALGGTGQFDSGVGSPSGKPPGSAIDSPGSGGLPSLAGTAQRLAMWGMGGPLVPMADALGASGILHAIAPAAFDSPRGSGPGASAKPVTPGGFDPSKPFSGTLPDGNVGSGSGAAPVAKPARGPMGNFDSKGAFGLPTSPPAGQEGASPDASRFAGMTGGQVLTSQRAAAGLPPVGQPQYSGVGPRGPGQSVGPMPASTATGLGGGGIAPLDNMMRAAAPQIAGGGAATGAAMVQHVQKAVSVAAPAAAAGGAAIGGGVSGGIAAGTTSTMTVTDTVMVKHVKHLVEVAAAALGIHSPSKEFDYLGRMTMAGFGQGAQRASAGTSGAMSDHMGGVLSAAQNEQRKFGYDYQDGSAPVVSFNPFRLRLGAPDEDPAKAEADRKASFGTQQQEYKPGSEGWWAAHDNRAAQLAAARENRQRAAIGGMTHDERRDQLLRNRAGNRERALANLHVSGHTKPSGDVNPFAGGSGDPFAPKSSGPSNPLLRAGRDLLNPMMLGRDLGKAWNQAGQNSVAGLTQGMTAHVGKAAAAGATVAGAAQGGHAKKEKSRSPSQVWAEMGGNSVAGLVQGMNAGGPVVAAAGAGMAGVVQAAAIGPMSDAGLMVGYAYSQNLLTGAQTVIKKADYQSLGLPSGIGQAAMAGLAKTGLLSAGSGAQSYKTPGNTPGFVVLPAASQSTPQVVEVHAHFHLDDQITTISQQAMVDVLSQATGSISLQPSA